jgi:hypothetical protein
LAENNNTNTEKSWHIITRTSSVVFGTDLE